MDVRGRGGVESQMVGDGHRQPAGPQRMLHRLAHHQVGGQGHRRDQFRQPETVAVRGMAHVPVSRSGSPTSLPERCALRLIMSISADVFCLPVIHGGRVPPPPGPRPSRSTTDVPHQRE